MSGRWCDRCGSAMHLGPCADTRGLTLTAHALDRLAERLDSTEVAAVVARLSRTRGERRPVVRVVARLNELRGQPWGAASNGDLVLALSIDRRVITVMYRRSTQPLTCRALRVAKVIDLDGAILDRVSE